MMAAQARVATPLAGRYLEQLCRHFGHRVAVSRDQGSGRIDFPDAPVRLVAEEQVLVMTIEARTAAGLDRAKEVMQSHLLRFAFRDPPQIGWQGLPAMPS